jgi:hypothetical protein
LVGEHGDTASLLGEVGAVESVPLDDVAAIERSLITFVDALHSGHTPLPRQDRVARYSRREGAVSLAKMLDELTN